jgi:hypothetical protein
MNLQFEHDSVEIACLLSTRHLVVPQAENWDPLEFPLCLVVDAGKSQITGGWTSWSSLNCLFIAV